MYIPKSLSSAFLRPTSYVSGPWSWPLRCLTVCGLSKIRTLAFQNVIQPNTVHLKLSSLFSDVFYVTIVKPIVNGNLRYGFSKTSHFQWNLRLSLWNPSLIFTTTKNISRIQFLRKDKHNMILTSLSKMYHKTQTRIYRLLCLIYSALWRYLFAVVLKPHLQKSNEATIFLLYTEVCSLFGET